MKPLVISDRVTIPVRELSWSASRSSGPGGQNVNKVATRVTLRFDLRGSESLTQSQKRRLRAQAERSQAQNLERARGNLRRLISKALIVPKHRVASRPSKTQKRRRLEHKRRVSEKKQRRSAVRLDD